MDLREDLVVMRSQHVEVPIPDDWTVAGLDRAFAMKKTAVKSGLGGTHATVLRKSRAGGPYRVKVHQNDGLFGKDHHLTLRVVENERALLVSPRDILGRTFTYVYCILAAVIFVAGTFAAAAGGRIGLGSAFMGIGLFIGAVGYGTWWATECDEKDDVAKAAQLTFDRARELKNDPSRR